MAASMLAGQVAAAGIQATSQMATNFWNAREAKKNRKFQAYMAKHAYRHAMNDMRLAGLNPILVAKLGGAATPPGAMARYANPAENLAGTALAITRQRQELRNMRAQERLLGQQGLTEMSKRELMGYTAGHTASETNKNLQALKILQSEVPYRKAYWKQQHGIEESGYGAFMRYLDRASSLVPFTGSAPQIGRSFGQ